MMGLFRKDKEVLICPKCGSEKSEVAGQAIAPDHSPAGSFGGKAIVPSLYRCKKCGYEGLFVSKEAEE